MSGSPRRNVPQGFSLDRRALLGIAGAGLVGAAFVAVRGLLSSPSTESLEVLSEASVPAEQVSQLVGRLGATFGTVNLSTFSAEGMDANAWRSLVSGTGSWLVLGATEDGVAALAESNCHDWADGAREMQDSLAYSLGADESLAALPLEGSIGTLLCNMDLLGSVGAGTVYDINSLAGLCSVLRESGIEPLALERVEAGSASVDVALRSSLAYWSGEGLPQPESREDAVAVMAASVLRNGRTQDGTSPCETREDALAMFKSGAAAMLIASSTDLAALLDMGFSCTAVSLPSVFGEEVSAFRPTRGIVASSRLPEAAYSTVLEWLRGDAGATAFGGAGSVAAARNGEGGLCVQDLPGSVLLATGSTVLVGDRGFGDLDHQALGEKVVSLWGQEEIGQIAYVDEIEVEA